MEETRTNTMETVNNENTNERNENTMIENTATIIDTIESYSTKSAQGYEVITLDFDFTPYTILKRETTYPYIVAYQYNVSTGTWAQGYYDFDSIEACEIFIEKKTHDDTLYGIYKVNFELPNNIVCTSYIGAHGTDKIIEYFENIEDAKNINIEYVTEREQLKFTNEHINNLKSRDEYIEDLTELLEGDSDLYVVCIESLMDNEGIYEDYQLFDMYDLDDQLSDKTPTEIIEMSEGFDTSDNYFRYDGYDLESIPYKEDYYSDNIPVSDLVEALTTNYNGSVRRQIAQAYGSDELIELLDNIDELN